MLLSQHGYPPTLVPSEYPLNWVTSVSARSGGQLTTVAKANAPVGMGGGRSTGGSGCVRTRENLLRLLPLRPTDPLFVFRHAVSPESHPALPSPLSAAEDRPPATACRSATFSRAAGLESKVARAGSASATTFWRPSGAERPEALRVQRRGARGARRRASRVRQRQARYQPARDELEQSRRAQVAARVRPLETGDRREVHGAEGDGSHRQKPPPPIRSRHWGWRGGWPAAAEDVPPCTISLQHGGA